MPIKPMTSPQSFTISRRQFLRAVAACGLAGVAATHLPLYPLAFAAPAQRPAASKPNLLVIIVDQMRDPQWFPDQAQLDQMLPNLARLRNGAIHFRNHTVAACMCTPSRSCMVTGLYAHQTYVMNTQVDHLHEDFPTWGDHLTSMGYQTWWFGKFHLEDPNGGACTGAVEKYGFRGGTCPDPNGAPGQGQNVDPQIAQQFGDWFQSIDENATPWCTTVSFVNPHDIMFYPRFTEQIPGEDNPPQVFDTLPDNYETPQTLQASNKPALQRALQTAAAQQFGIMRFTGPNYEREWLEMLDLYLELYKKVDTALGQVLDALEKKPAVAQNTIIIFTSDHGDYAGSHGLRGKGGAAYEEGVRVPFYVKDPTGVWASQPETARTQLTSAIDLTPLLMTLASGSADWRANAQYEHLANHFDLATLLKDPNATGRSHLLYTTDERALEEAPSAKWNDAPAFHVIAYRTTAGKVASYSYWDEQTTAIKTEKQEFECYDYSTDKGRLELENVAVAGNTLYEQLVGQLNIAITTELRKPLPSYLTSTQQVAFLNYLDNLNGSPPAETPKAYLPLVQNGG